MSNPFRLFAIVAIAGSVLVSASIAEANNDQNVAERLQQPTAHTSFWNFQPPHSVWNWSTQPRTYQPRTYQPRTAPTQKSWRWQRSSRAELHHPGTQKNRGR